MHFHMPLRESRRKNDIDVYPCRVDFSEMREPENSAGTATGCPVKRGDRRLAKQPFGRARMIGRRGKRSFTLPLERP